MSKCTHSHPAHSLANLGQSFPNSSPSAVFHQKLLHNCPCHKTQQFLWLGKTGRFPFKLIYNRQGCRFQAHVLTRMLKNWFSVTSRIGCGSGPCTGAWVRLRHFSMDGQSQQTQPLQRCWKTWAAVWYCTPYGTRLCKIYGGGHAAVRLAIRGLLKHSYY